MHTNRYPVLKNSETTKLWIVTLSAICHVVELLSIDEDAANEVKEDVSILPLQYQGSVLEGFDNDL